MKRFKACHKMLHSCLRQAFFMALIIMISAPSLAQNIPDLPAACLAEGTPCGCPVPPDGIDFSPQIDGVHFQNIRLMPVEGSDPYYRLFTTLVNNSEAPLRLTQIETPLGNDISFTTLIDGREDIRKAPFDLTIPQNAVLPLDGQANQFLTIKSKGVKNTENTSVPVIFHFAAHRDIRVTVPLFSEKGLVAFQPKVGPDGNCQF